MSNAEELILRYEQTIDDAAILAARDRAIRSKEVLPVKVFPRREAAKVISQHAVSQARRRRAMGR